MNIWLFDSKSFCYLNVKKLYSLAILVFLSGSLTGQSQLSKTDAVKIMLENNYGIKIARNNNRIAENNTSKKLNNYLPQVNASIGADANLGGSSQKFSSGDEANVSNAFTWGNNAAISANYTLIDKRRDVIMEQLKELVTLSDLEVRRNIETNLFQLYSAYLEVASLTDNLAVLEETIELSRERLKRIQLLYDYGRGLRLDVLNAEVDKQRDSINYLNLQQILNNAKRNLNLIMGRSIDEDYEVDTDVNYSNDLTLESLLSSVRTGNVDLLISNQNMAIDQYDLRIIDAEKKPKISSTAAYSFNYQNNDSKSFITAQTNYGLALGVSLSWSIFDGGARSIRKQNVHISIENQQILQEQLLQELERDVRNTWESYQNALAVLEVEQASLETNQLNFNRTEELYNSGQANSVEFRQAQLNLLNASTNFNLAKYDAKVFEVLLMQLSGRILDN